MSDVVVTDERCTCELARRLAAALHGGVTIGLRGGLGAGKTTLVRYLVEALGGNSVEVASPSYTLQHEYRLPRGEGKPHVIEHWDLYRLSTMPEELYEPPEGGVVRLIEWPERCPELADSLDGSVDISLDANGTRHVTLGGVCRLQGSITE